MGGYFKSKLRELFPEGEMDHRLNGVWEAKVLATEDKDDDGHITLAIPELTDLEEWKPVPPIQGQYSASVPKVGQWVWVVFKGLNPETPYYFGGWWPSEQRLPDATGKPDQQIYQVPDENGVPLLTFMHNEGKELEIRLDQAGSYLKFNAITKAVDFFSDDPGYPASTKGSKKAPININGRLTDGSGFGAARQFDKVLVLNSMTGAPMEGIIREGSTRVILSNDKSVP